MSKKAFRPPKLAPLLRVTAEEITDPAEQAALDAMRQRLKRKQGGRDAIPKRKGGKAACRSAAKRRA